MIIGEQQICSFNSGVSENPDILQDLQIKTVNKHIYFNSEFVVGGTRTKTSEFGIRSTRTKN